MLRRLTAALAATVAFASVPAVAGTTLNGAGGTAIYPVLQVWAQNYNVKTGTAVNYQAIGSGGGIKQIEAKTVDFANSDKPLMHEDIVKNDLVQFPQVVISIVPVVNLKGIKAGELTIDGPTLADIYLGKITKWNDPALEKLNPHVKLPDEAILVVHRSDGSGTTFNFTNYLGKVSPEWKQKVGSDTSVQWPVGIGGKGNAGVAASVQQADGSIGYVEYAYVAQNHMVYMDMINHDGKRLAPSMEAFQQAAGHADFKGTQDFYLILTDQPGAKSWPITAATYMLMRKDYAMDKNNQVLKFLDYALHDGQAASRKLDYVPFPENIVKQIEASWTASFGKEAAWK
ncbi:MAG: phosphate ABC transporter substrate-binding protein PstS [Alphaproteobacteria bacterium]|nr:phosphate ABC transporter substrate-binding protein PstS [Alphaproteobacteria bacterium]MDE2012864.1 phosphate ABC transporter substrate-binding protein PstS [Alphaproteobacteria bacterium]MDE2074262.1 phosphate ABC transporter substrate-binding protein PstS [Alphaproteobacteria bacterium]MDE2350299.1 phosphate ABC transporter substrate-binding protein PstS [Alphaproteobacteria bacterium]